MVYEILLILSYCINYPVLLFEGLVSLTPIVLLFENCRAVQNFLADKQGSFVTLRQEDSMASLERHLLQGNSKGLLFLVPENSFRKQRNVKLMEKLNFLSSISNAHGLLEQPVTMPCIIGYVGLMTDNFDLKYDDTVIFIPVTENIASKGISPEDLIPDPDKIAVALDEYQKIREGTESDVNWLYASAAFLYPKMREKGLLDEYNAIVSHIPQIVKKSRYFHDSDDILSLVKEMLLDYANADGFADLYDLYDQQTGQEIASASKEWFEDKFFVKGQELFMAESRFKKICSEYLENIPIDVVKGRLKDAGIIKSDSDGRYTTKMYYFSTNKACYPRMMRFNMQSISNDNVSLYDILKLYI